MSDLSAADAMLIGNNSGFGTGNTWIFLLFAAMLFLGNGGGFFGGNANNGQYATQSQVRSMFDYSNLLDQNRDLSTAIGQGVASSIAATNQSKYDNINVLKDVQMALQGQISGISSMESSINDKLSTCCSEMQRSIDGVNYNNAINTAGINANTTAQTQKILDALAQNKIEALQGQINQLQLQNAVAGVVRYPSSTTFSAGIPPIWGGVPPYAPFA